MECLIYPWAFYIYCALQGLGVTCDVADNGLEALVACRKKEFDLVLMVRERLGMGHVEPWWRGAWVVKDFDCMCSDAVGDVASPYGGL